MDLLAQLATFVRVVESQSLSTAARDQRLSLAAVSRQLRALEDDLGVTLIARTTRSVRVTDAGRRYYDHAVRILGQIDDARTSVTDSRKVEGRLTVSSGVSFGVRFVAPVVAELVAKYPSLSIDLRLEDRIVDLVADGVDVAIRGGVVPPDSTSVIAHPILSFERIPVAAPAYLKRKRAPKDPCELVRHCCLAQVSTSGLISEWRFHHRTKPAEERIVRINHRIECNAPLGLLEAARLGAGIVFIGDWLAKPDIKKGLLVHVLPEWAPASSTQFWALHRSDTRGSPRVRAFLDALRKQIP